MNKVLAIQVDSKKYEAGNGTHYLISDEDYEKSKTQEGLLGLVARDIIVQRSDLLKDLDDDYDDTDDLEVTIVIVEAQPELVKDISYHATSENDSEFESCMKGIEKINDFIYEYKDPIRDYAESKLLSRIKFDM